MTTIEPHSSEPPAWAQEVLTWLVPASSEESIPGDLLEEYRDTVLPSRGRWRANVWYVRQVGGFLFRLAWIFILVNASAIILRTVHDTFAPPDFSPHSFQWMSMLSSYTAIATFMLAGAYSGYRLEHVRAAGVTAMTAAALGHALGLSFDAAWFYAVIQHDPAKLNFFYVTGGWGEEIGMPIVITVLAAPLGLFGGFAGQLMRRLHGRRIAPRP